MSRTRPRHARRPEPLAPRPAQPMIWSLRVAIVVIAFSVVASLGWRFSGGSSYIISTPSMCPSLCVGSLVLDQPAGTHFHVGEVISFTPFDHGPTYTHRIVAVFPNGTLETKGDAANIVDPWRVTPAEVRGRMVAEFSDLGWYDLALPFLALALTLILISRAMFTTRHRREFDRLCVSLMVTLPIWVLHPLVRGVVVETSSLGPGVEQSVVVNTGVFPAEFRVPGGRSASFITPGHRAVIEGPARRGGQLDFQMLASFHWYGWALVILAACLPLIIYLANLARPSRRHELNFVLRGRHPDLHEIESPGVEATPGDESSVQLTSH